jgi:hypothetical protein
VLYLSSAAESTPLTAGLWYLTDADAAPTSTTPQSIGVAVSAIAINASGTIRLAGLVTTSGAVVVGTTYYVSATAGAITSSAPALSRQVGVAMTTSSLLLAATTAVASLLPNPITQDLLFTDATYDIGKSGASRPRDGFFSRNAVIGGTLGVSGISTFTADLVATGASMSFQDAEGVTFGTGNDATVKFDGTDLVIAPAAVGAGDVHVSGGSVEVDDSESFTLGTGKDATIIYDGTDLTISPAAVGSGDLVIAGASAEFADSEGVTLGTGKDATLQYDGTNLVINPQAVGSGDTVFSSGRVGIGTASPDSILDLESAADAPTLTIHSTVATGGGVKTGGILRIEQAGGTGEPSETNDTPGVIAFVGQATDYQFSAGDIKSVVETGGSLGRSDMVVGLAFYTKASGAAGDTERMRIYGTGLVNVVGTFTAGTKTFQIPHPLPELKATRNLIHACLEGPRLDLIYRGVATLVDGVATVDLDDAAGMTTGTWVLLCRDPMAMVTNATGFASVRGSVSGSTLTITCEEGTCTDSVSWLVAAERQDDAIKAQSSTDEDGHLIIEPLHA